MKRQMLKGEDRGLRMTPKPEAGSCELQSGFVTVIL
jgi:hypothetical protein